MVTTCFLRPMLSPCLFDASLLFTFGFIWWGWDPKESKMWQLFYDLSLSCDPILWVECNDLGKALATSALLAQND